MTAADERIRQPLECAYYWEREHGESILFTQPINGVARDWTWTQAMSEARRMAAYLVAQDWPAGSHVVIMSRNSAWWIMADLAIWMAGHVSVPIYTSLTVASAQQLLEHCDPIACFVGPVENAELISNLISRPGLAVLHCIRFPNAPPCEAKGWDDIMAGHPPLAGYPLRSPDEVATIIYTSGTTGNPKGVMHSFTAFAYFAKAVAQTAGEPRHRCLSYLPLAHIAERALTETSALYFGWRLFFCEGVPTFLDDLRRAEATVFFSVPRLYGKLRQRVLDKIPQRTLANLLYVPVVSAFTRKTLLNRLGLGTVQVASSGSAALQLDLLHWFRNLGLPLVEGYGASETGITHTPIGKRSKPGFVGYNAPGVDTKLDENRQVLVRSPMNTLGYYKDPAATSALFTDDGFIQTGDLGEIDSEGWLKLNGRIKEQFKTTKGKYVSPAAIEGLLSSHSMVESCIVMGSNLDAPFVVVALSDSAIELSRHGAGHKNLESTFENLVKATNAKLEHHEQLQYAALVNSRWTVEKGYITPTMKLKRQALENHYNPLVAGWLAQNKPVVWHVETEQ